uniref:Uncharacterized protein n=1 Tax=Rhizophora mucronata TaxID=61149 RepID=A0A2P2PVJ7_RHIMU
MWTDPPENLAKASLTSWGGSASVILNFLLKILNIL